MSVNHIGLRLLWTTNGLLLIFVLILIFALRGWI